MRAPITAGTLGFCYLLHFSRPLGNLANARAQAAHLTAEEGSIMLQAHTAAHLASALAALDQATQDLEDSVNVALADLPGADEYKLLTQIAGAVNVVRAVVCEYRTTARQLWPES